MDDSPWDTLIVGQGLAGSLLAWQLIQQGHRVLIFSDSSQASTSRMAAGLINPVTGKRLVKSALVDTCLPYAIHLYEQLERQFGQQFFHQQDMLRIFNSPDHCDAWEKRSQSIDYQAYLGERIQQNQYPAITMPLGGCKQKQTGYLDTVSLLDCLHSYFQQRGAIKDTTISYSDIEFDDHRAQIKNYRARQIIFCEGHQASNNPWFNWLPFKLAKGEILTLNIKDYTIKQTINAGHWLLPLHNGQYKFGASYQWDELNEIPDESVKQQLLESLGRLLKQHNNIEVSKHEAGIRPCTRDTHPFIGLHPQYPRIGIFNGFGSKGSLMIPYYSQQFAAHIDTHTFNMKEADIRRYWHDH